MTTGERLDVVVLAGGTARRLDGASKPDVVVGGARLLDHVLDGVAFVRDRLPPGQVVVVAPESVLVPPGVLRALEDPPLGGPVAGIAAGLARLSTTVSGNGSEETMSGTVTDVPAPLTAVVTCDAPEAWRALPALAKELEDHAGADGACAVDHGQVQYLLGIYRTAALAERVAPGGAALRDVAVRRTLGGMDLIRLELSKRGEKLAHVARDLDTWADIRAYASHPHPRVRSI
ncbi:molybdenum cofactor guanylyltransferase [Actinomyces qiguomingii]|uniref:molybdenum cofactor guanylyltransferase n=1 Tax=Actinomyces qiguomingii TaxID=2057800 RepID=UPI000CA03640|nr:NTP transferase domain-containing protein [Actinomyces qiguomingii]